MSISLHTGNPRTGKTYGMHRDIMKCLHEGLIVYANYKINWNGERYRVWNWKKFRFEWREVPASNLRYWKRVEEWKDFEKGIIAIDEAHVYLNSRRWEKLDEETEKKLAQHGKDGLHIIGTVQNLRRLDTVMRELIDYWYLYKVFPPVPKKPWKKHRPILFFKWQVLMETDISPRALNSTPTIYFFRKKFADTYNTLQKISNS